MIYITVRFFMFILFCLHFTFVMPIDMPQAHLFSTAASFLNKLPLHDNIKTIYHAIKNDRRKSAQLLSTVLVSAIGVHYAYEAFVTHDLVMPYVRKNAYYYYDMVPDVVKVPMTVLCYRLPNAIICYFFDNKAHVIGAVIMSGMCRYNGYQKMSVLPLMGLWVQAYYNKLNSVEKRVMDELGVVKTEATGHKNDLVRNANANKAELIEQAVAHKTEIMAEVAKVRNDLASLMAEFVTGTEKTVSLEKKITDLTTIVSGLEQRIVDNYDRQRQDLLVLEIQGGEIKDFFDQMRQEQRVYGEAVKSLQTRMGEQSAVLKKIGEDVQGLMMLKKDFENRFTVLDLGQQIIQEGNTKILNHLIKSS